MIPSELKGTRSRLFENFPYPFDGKQSLFEIARAFAAEFNESAFKYLRDHHGIDRANNWTPLTVTGAYPTTKQQCPRIAIVRTGSSPRLVGLGAEIETCKHTSESGEVSYRAYRGQTITDTIEVSLCCLNEQMRDELFVWFQQYVLDGITWLIPQLADAGNVYDVRCTNAVDDVVEYQGTAAQPGFEFYVARLEFMVLYDLIVLRDVDILKQMVNWQNCTIVEYAPITP